MEAALRDLQARAQADRPAGQQYRRSGLTRLSKSKESGASAIDGPRPSRRQPRNRPPADVVAPADLGQRFPATLPALDRLALLVRGELRLASELHAVRHGARAALAGARGSTSESTGGALTLVISAN